MKKFSCIFILLLIVISTSTIAQSDSRWFIMPEGLGFSNQLEYSYNVEKETEILENWLNLDYTKGIFSAGIRFDVFQPNDPDPSISRGKERYADISYKYFGLGIGSAQEGLDITLGNYYALIGRGMVFKSYEDRNIRVDNNLLGLQVVGKYAGFILTALSGTPENSKAERKDILHMVDLEYRGLKGIKIGGTYASNLPHVDGIARTDMASLRFLTGFWNVDIYTEYGIMKNNDIEKNVFDNKESIIGRGFYGNLNFYIGPVSLLGEYKYYDNFSFTTQDRTVNYNTPPSLRLENSYMLPNRHPSPLDPNNEKGFQLEAGLSVDEETYVNTTYTHTNTLPYDSYYQRIIGTKNPITTQLKEFYFQAQRDWSSALTTLAVLAYNEELATNTKNVTPIIEGRYYFGDVNTIKVILEHQHTTDWTTHEQYYTDVLLIEYLRSPQYSISLVTEVQTKEPVKNRRFRKFWGFIQFGYKLGNHTDISLLIGTRQAGNICIGGVCRYEPEFRGIEIKMLTRL